MISFAEALDQTIAQRRYLLLGNGFSISLFPDCFMYKSLFQEAKNKGLLAPFAPLEDAFGALGTIDFEVVMEALKASVKLAPLYGFDGAKMAHHSEALKNILVEAIAGKHPARPGNVTDDQFNNCRAFLNEFIGNGRDNKIGKIFSLNYDLLLYWTVLHDEFDIDWETGEVASVAQELSNDDGFRAPEDNYDADYVSWDQFNASRSQSITFLHGALHIYERGPEITKLCWERSGNHPLMEQIRSALDADRYPLFVSEGSSRSKMAKINKSAYLAKGIRSFSECCNKKGESLFIIGHSLADNDDHILRRIKKGKIGSLYVSVFGDPNSVDNLAVRAKAEALANGRPDSVPLSIEYIDADSLHIWTH